jgi:hypothetical protein
MDERKDFLISGYSVGVNGLDKKKSTQSTFFTIPPPVQPSCYVSAALGAGAGQHLRCLRRWGMVLNHTSGALGR